MWKKYIKKKDETDYFLPATTYSHEVRFTTHRVEKNNWNGEFKQAKFYMRRKRYNDFQNARYKSFVKQKQ